MPIQATFGPALNRQRNRRRAHNTVLKLAGVWFGLRCWQRGPEHHLSLARFFEDRARLTFFRLASSKTFGLGRTASKTYGL